jgi:hypothetical protein
MKNVTKTYKFIYMRNWSNMDVPTQYVFANRQPKGYSNKWEVSNFFHRVDDFTMRKYFTDKKIRRKRNFANDYLNPNMPANEANITQAFVKYFTYELNVCRRRLTYLNKHADAADFNPMGYNVYNPNYYRKMIKHHKHNLAIWKAKYQALKDQGVYTYLELIK